MGVLFVIWQSSGRCKDTEEISQRQCDNAEGNSDNQESNIVIHADCHSANKGLFGGMAAMVLSLVSVILFFIAINDRYAYSLHQKTSCSILQNENVPLFFFKEIRKNWRSHQCGHISHSIYTNGRSYSRML